MLSVEQARAYVLERIETLPLVDVTLQESWGLVAAQDILARAPLPRFDNSAMDGYAIRSADVALADASQPVQLTIAGEVRAAMGTPPALERGQAIRIATGAGLPAGADAVVPIEEIEETGGRISVKQPASPGKHIRRTGEDLETGDVAIPRGVSLGAGELALLAALGQDRVQVRRRPRVSVLVTGDELVPPDEEAGPGQIYDSNSTAMETLVREAGAEVILREQVADTADATASALARAGRSSDIVVCCGGVSVGPYDLVKSAVADAGTVDHWRVAMQPGKPVVIGNVGEVPFLGLPGNPVSVHVTFEQFVRPALKKMSGHTSLLRPRIQARLTQPIHAPSGRRRFVRVRLSPGEANRWDATPTGAQGSHIQSSLVNCHGVAIVPEDREGAEIGAVLTVEVWRLPET